LALALLARATVTVISANNLLAYNSVQRMHNTKKHPNRDGQFDSEAS